MPDFVPVLGGSSLFGQKWCTLLFHNLNRIKKPLKSLFFFLQESGFCCKATEQFLLLGGPKDSLFFFVFVFFVIFVFGCLPCVLISLFSAPPLPLFWFSYFLSFFLFLFLFFHCCFSLFVAFFLFLSFFLVCWNHPNIA